MTKHPNTIRIPLVVAFLTILVALLIHEQNAVRARNRLWTPTTDQLKVTLIRDGLDPTALAAAGVSPSSVGGIIQNTTAYMTEHPGTLQAADSAFSEARNQCDSLLRIIQAGQATPQQIGEYATWSNTLVQAQNEQKAILDQFHAVAAAALNESQKAILGTLRLNRGWDLSPEFLALERSEAQWVQLRDALNNERVSAQMDQEPDPEVKALLIQLRADPIVAAAAANLAANLPAVDAAWTQAVGD